MRYRAVLFDFDGTVYDTLEGITKCVQYALDKRGIHKELGELRKFAGPPLLEIFKEEFGFSDDEAVQVVNDFRDRYHPTGALESRPFPGIGELAMKLKDAGFITGIATSKPQPVTEQLLERSSLTECFDVIVGSHGDMKDNAKWQILTRAIEAAGTGLSDTVLIGDTKYDVDGANKVGIPCIGVSWGYAAEGELLEHGAVCVVDTMEELYELLVNG